MRLTGIVAAIKRDTFGKDSQLLRDIFTRQTTVRKRNQAPKYTAIASKGEQTISWWLT